MTTISRSRSIRRMLVDLTPLIDIIMILLFGVMINSAEMFRSDSSTLVAENDKLQLEIKELRESGEAGVAKKAFDDLMKERLELADRLKSVEKMLADSKNDLAAAVGELERRKSDFSQAMAKVLTMSDRESKEFRDSLEKMSPADAAMLDRAVARIRTWQSPADVYKGIRRIEEMAKFFDFIDVHIDGDEKLSLSFNGQPFLTPQPVYRNKQRLVDLLRQVVEGHPGRQSLMILSTNDFDADLTTTEFRDEAMREVETYFESLPRGPTIQVIALGSLPKAAPRPDPAAPDQPVEPTGNDGAPASSTGNK